MLDVYVMPLGQYLQGKFEPPGLLPDETERTYGRGKPDDAPDEASARVAAMQVHMSEALKTTSADADQGPVAWDDGRRFDALPFAQRVPKRLLHGLRSIAAHQQYPHRMLFVATRFRLRADPRTHKGLKKIYAGASTDYPHLMRHSDNRGFWFPGRFAEPIECNEPKWWRIGSVDGLAEELTRIGSLIEDMAPGADRQYLQAGWGSFHQAAKTACELRLPLIIDG